MSKAPRSYRMAHKYGWFDYFYDVTAAKPDAVMILICIILIALIIAGYKMGILV